MLSPTGKQREPEFIRAIHPTLQRIYLSNVIQGTEQAIGADDTRISCTKPFITTPSFDSPQGCVDATTRQVSGPGFYTRRVPAQNAADQNPANIHP